MDTKLNRVLLVRDKDTYDSWILSEEGRIFPEDILAGQAKILPSYPPWQMVRDADWKYDWTHL